MHFEKLLLIFAIFFVPFQVLAQFDKPNNLFQEKRYAAAAPLYEEALKSKESLVAKSRLAYCYRMLNQTEKAENLYADVVSHEKAKSDTYFYYAEALMSNGKYKDAKQWFQKYYVLEPTDSIALARAEACDKVPLIPSYFKGLTLIEFPFNTDADDNMPVFWQKGIVFTSDRPSGKALLKEKSGWTGRDYLKLYYSKYDAERDTFDSPESFSGKLNELNKNTASASFTADGNTVVFSRNGDNTNRKNEVTVQLFTAERGNGRWKNEHKLEFCNQEQNYMHPSVSADGNLLFYAANSGGQGGFDIYMAQKTKNGWGRTRNLGEIVNTRGNEAFPYFHRDGRLFFCSKGHPGFGGFDIFVTKFDSTNNQWLPPVNLGMPINSSLDDIGFFLAANDSVGCFTSGRSGGDDDLFLFWMGKENGLKKIFPSETAMAEMPSEPPVVDSTTATNPSIDASKTAPRRSIFAENSSVPPMRDTLTTAIVPKKTEENPQKAASEESTLPILPKNLPDLDRALETAQVKKNELFILPDVRYDSATAIVPTPASTAELSILANLMLRYPKLCLEIQSHTESTGNDKANLALSKARAAQIVNLLVEKGIEPKRLKPKGFGEKKLLNDCKNGVDCPVEKHLENRRVLLRVMKF